MEYLLLIVAEYLLAKSAASLPVPATNNSGLAGGGVSSSLIDFYTNSKFVTACHYCKGRGFGFGEIEAAIQTKEPLEYVKVS